jgi:hypothetical protein
MVGGLRRTAAVLLVRLPLLVNPNFWLVGPQGGNSLHPKDNSSLFPMNEMTQLIPLIRQSIKIYASASRRLRRKVSHKAPTAIELINFELAGRDPRDIAACFLDHLRDLERRQPAGKPAGRGVAKRRVPSVRQATWLGRGAPSSSLDSARN